MSVAININIRDRATPVINQLDSKLIDDAGKHTVGTSVMRQILDHLTTLDSERPNALGGRRTHFYAQAGKSTHYEITDTGAVVSIDHIGIAQRYFGGKIEREDGGPLTIPARAEAHGRRAREFNNLVMLWGRNGPYALAERESMDLRLRRSTKKIKGGGKAVYKYFAHGEERGGGIFYWLVKSVTQQPDPTVLPEMSAMEENAFSAVTNYINNILKLESRINS